MRAAPLLALALMGCAAERDPTPTFQKLASLEPGRADCTVTESQDRDRNGFTDFQRTVEYDAAGHPALLRETETENGGDPPEDPSTFRVETVWDDRGNPESREEGPDDDSARTLTAWRWDYSRSLLQHRGEVDRRNNGQDLTIWTWEYANDGRALSWTIDAAETTGLLTQMTYLWEDGGVGEVRRFDAIDGGDLLERARWTRDNDGAGRVLRMVEIVDGQEGREATYSRDDRGRLRSQVGGWGDLGEWSAQELTFDSPCFQE